jgi:hypothetical protein
MHNIIEERAREREREAGRQITEEMFKELILSFILAVVYEINLYSALSTHLYFLSHSLAHSPREAIEKEERKKL